MSETAGPLPQKVIVLLKCLERPLFLSVAHTDCKIFVEFDHSDLVAFQNNVGEGVLRSRRTET